MTGTIFGRYNVESKIGEGSMGVVYRARDLRLERLVALKVLNESFRSQATAWGWLLREAKNASALNHPGICTIYDVGEEEGQPYIAMEYVQGQTLSSLLVPPGFNPVLVGHYGTLVAKALAHAHERGIIHRDIKSANIITTPGNGLKILDFGLARRVRASSLRRVSTSNSSLNEVNPIVGTIHYMAPEVLRGERAHVWSDIWSLGVLLFELSTGTLPFTGNTVFELSTAIMVSAPKPLPMRVPVYLARVIGRCLNKEATARYQCAKDVAIDLQKSRRAPMATANKNTTPIHMVDAA